MLPSPLTLGPVKSSPSSFCTREGTLSSLPLAGQLPLDAGHRSVCCRGPLSLGLVTSEDCRASWAVERGTLGPEPWGPQTPSHGLLGSLQPNSSGEQNPFLPCGVGWGRAELRAVQVLLCERSRMYSARLVPVADVVSGPKSVLLPRLVEQGLEKES